MPTAVKALTRGKMTPATVLLHPHKASKQVKRIFKTIEGKSERFELNLYIVGYEDAEDLVDEAHVPHADDPTPLTPPEPAPAPAADKSPTFPTPEHSTESESE
jgi:succinate dehydrogenase / fumarate reductase iron-sulfur subunit